MARHYLSCYLKIPYDNFNKSESPDFTTNINGNEIGIEVTTVHPSEIVTKADALNNNYIYRCLFALLYSVVLWVFLSFIQK